MGGVGLLGGRTMDVFVGWSWNGGRIVCGGPSALDWVQYQEGGYRVYLWAGFGIVAE